jgi:hypothetical protein
MSGPFMAPPRLPMSREQRRRLDSLIKRFYLRLEIGDIATARPSALWHCCSMRGGGAHSLGDVQSRRHVP